MWRIMDPLTGLPNGLRTTLEEVKIIRLDKNYGFAGGYNLALDKIEARYFVLLNSDIEVTENWLATPGNLYG